MPAGGRPLVPRSGRARHSSSGGMAMGAGDRVVAVVGARALPEACAGEVAAVVRHFLGRGWGIGSGGAWGADAYALRAVVAAGAPACRRSVVYLPGSMPASSDGALGAFVARGGR